MVLGAKGVRKSTKTTKAGVKSKLKYATAQEMKELIQQLTEEHPYSESLSQFEPKGMPRAVPQDWLNFCFSCRDADAPLEKCDDLKVCSTCRNKTLTRDIVMSRFGFSKGEAMNLKPQHGRNGFYGGSICYIFTMTKIVKGLKEKHGCLSNWLRESEPEACAVHVASDDEE